MRLRHLFHLVCPLAFVLPTRAAPVDSAIVAAMKVAEAPNYTWHTDVADDASSYTITGTTERATDFSLVTMPLSSGLVAASATRRGPGGSPRRSSGAVSTVVFQGSENYVVQVDDTWRTADEAAAGDRNTARRGGPSGGPSGMGAGGGSMRTRRGPGGSRAPGAGEGESLSAFSNVQSTLSRPHEEIGVIVGGGTDWKIEGEMVSGLLPETTAILLLIHPGQKDIVPKRASGTFRFWVQRGVLVKYETRLDGVLVVSGREVAVHQTATTTVSQLGATTVDVPAEAKRKLAGGS